MYFERKLKSECIHLQSKIKFYTLYVESRPKISI